MAKVIFKGWAKADDPIYKLGLVVSGQRFNPVPKCTTEAKDTPSLRATTQSSPSKITTGKPDPTAIGTGKVYWTEADDSLYNEPATLSFKYNRVPPKSGQPGARQSKGSRRARKVETVLGEVTRDQAIEIATRERCIKRDPEPQSHLFVRVPNETELPEGCLNTIHASDEMPGGLYRTWADEPAWCVWFKSPLSGVVESHVIIVSKRTGEVLYNGSAPQEV